MARTPPNHKLTTFCGRSNNAIKNAPSLDHRSHVSSLWRQSIVKPLFDIPNSCLELGPTKCCEGEARRPGGCADDPMTTERCRRPTRTNSSGRAGKSIDRRNACSTPPPQAGERRRMARFRGTEAAKGARRSFALASMPFATHCRRGPTMAGTCARFSSGSWLGGGGGTLDNGISCDERGRGVDLRAGTEPRAHRRFRVFPSWSRSRPGCSARRWDAGSTKGAFTPALSLVRTWAERSARCSYPAGSFSSPCRSVRSRPWLARHRRCDLHSAKAKVSAKGASSRSRASDRY